jgi:glycerophosphoryl diester phosphodiesterase
VLALLFLSCSNQKKMQAKPEDEKKEAYVPGDFDKQGHRGCRGLMPENTVAGMLYALGTPITTLEMDVVITRDKKVVLSHEPFFNHEITTKPDGKYVTEAEEKNLNIHRMTYEEVKKYDVGMKPHPRFPKQQKIKAIKPLLADVIDSVKTDMMTRRRPFPYYNIETKCLPAGDGIFHPGPDEFVELLMAVIKEKNMEEQVIIQSFDFRTLKYLHQKYPHIKTAMLIEDDDKRGLEEQLKALGYNPTIYSPHFSLVNETLLKKCHDKNIKVIPWTVNEKSKIEELKNMGVDGIITDYPDLFY